MRVLAQKQSGPAVYYYMAGTLGSTRVMTDSTGNVCFDAEYYPYGREKDIVNNCPQNFKFTGKERDPETGLDNFGARYYASSYTRFMSPDLGHAGASLANPESWDAYTYTLDNPETLTDPTGTFSLLNSFGSPEENMFMPVWAEENGGYGCCSWETEMAAAVADALARQQNLSQKSMNAIGRAASEYHYKAATFEKDLLGASGEWGINPNVLVGLGMRESSLNPKAPNGGLFQIQYPGAYGIDPADIGDFNAQIPAAAESLSLKISYFGGNVDLGIAAWTLGDAGTRRLFSEGGMPAVRGALLSAKHPNEGTVGSYIDYIMSF